MTKMVRVAAQGVVGGLAGGAILAGLEWLRLRGGADVSVMPLLARRLVLAGSLIGLLITTLIFVMDGAPQVLRFAGRRKYLLSAVVLGAICWIPAGWFSAVLLGGPAISRSSWIGLLKIGVPVALCVGIAVLIGVGSWMRRRAMERSPWSVACALPLLVIGLGLDHWDSTEYRGLYAQVHQVVAVLAALIFGWAVVLVLAALRCGRRSLIVAVGVIVVALIWEVAAPPTNDERFVLLRRTVQGEKLAELARFLSIASDEGMGEVAASQGYFEQRARDRENEALLREQLTGQFGDERPKNLLWVTVDTLRHDHLECYGYEKETAPNLAAFASRGVLFENAYSQFPLTSFSFQSMFFSRYPEATPLYRQMTGAKDFEGGCRTLASMLSDRGYSTYSIPAVSGAALREPIYKALALGFSGVEPDDGKAKTAEVQVAAAKRFLEDRGEDPFFLWLHLMDPHGPYVDHEVFGHSSDDVGRYDSEISYLDGALGDLLRSVKTLDRDRDTIIVINSDHGEAFGEHGTRFHGTTLYEEQVHIPLIIRVPGIAPGRIASTVGNIDIVPTVLDLLDEPSIPTAQGRSLAGLLLNGDGAQLAPASLAYAEIPEAIPFMSPGNTGRSALRMGRWKIILDRRGGLIELYDLDADTAEEHNVASAHPDVCRRLRGAIAAIRKESRELNIPLNGRTVAEELNDAAERIAVAQVPEQLRILRELCKGPPESKRQAFVRQHLLATQSHPLVRALVFELPNILTHEELESAALLAIRSNVPLGMKAAALESLSRQQSKGRQPTQSTQEELATLLDGMDVGGNGLRAALILARCGDRRPLPFLLREVESSDEDTRIASAIALSELGNSGGIVVLRSALNDRALESDVTAPCLAALARLSDREAICSVLMLISDRYQNFRVKLAAADYLLAFGGEDAVPGFVYLLSGWDPEIARQVTVFVEKAYGVQRCVQLKQAARRLQSAIELEQQRKYAKSLVAWQEAAVLCGGPRAGIVCRLRAAHRLPVEDRRAFLSGLEEAPPKLLREARRLCDPIRSRQQLSLVQLQPQRRPAKLGVRPRAQAMLRNDGKSLVPGGNAADAPSFRLSRKGMAKASLYRRFLPIGGLAPGEAVSIQLDMDSQPNAATLELQLMQSQVLPPQRSTPSLPVLGVEEGTPQSLPVVFTGASLLRNWGGNPSFAPGRLCGDGSVEFTSLGFDPILEGPLLASGPKGVKVELDYTVYGAGVEHETLQCFYRYPGDQNFMASQIIGKSHAGGGQSTHCELEIPLLDGRGPSRLRLDFFQTACVVRIQRITISAL